MEIQSSFSRKVSNTEKMGAYYTDPFHCKLIAKMLSFPQDKVAVLEPSIGNAVAVRTVCEGKDVDIFGVELNAGVYADLRKEADEHLHVINADFLNGIKVSNGVFSFLFGNPPYLGNDAISGRNEKSFLEKAYSYLTKDAVVVWVISEATMKDVVFIRYWKTHFSTEAAYRFQDKEFAKYHQYVLVGKKIPRLMLTRSMVDEWNEWLPSISVIPDDPSERIEVMPSNPDDVRLFSTLQFHAEEAYEAILKGGKRKIDYLGGELTSQPVFGAQHIGRPPCPLKNDSMYLLAVSGAGQGLAGTEGEDLHLQRGVAKVVEDVEVTDKGEHSSKSDQVEVVTTRTSITMTLIESDGTITHLI